MRMNNHTGEKKCMKFRLDPPTLGFSRASSIGRASQLQKMYQNYIQKHGQKAANSAERPNQIFTNVHQTEFAIHFSLIYLI
jgi:hypothetical protein